MSEQPVQKKKLVITKKNNSLGNANTLDTNENNVSHVLLITDPVPPITNTNTNTNKPENDIIDNIISIATDKEMQKPIKIQNDYKLFKLKLDKSVLLVDTSYWVYYRFFALRNWYTKAHPEVNTNENYNWLEDKEFMAKYEKLFIESIYNITLKYNIPMSNVVFCIDCPYKEIWRYEIKEDYKGTRLESHKKNNFNSFEIFNIVRDTIIPKLQTKYKMSAIMVNKCEADDIVGNLAPFLERNLIKADVNGPDSEPNNIATLVDASQNGEGAVSDDEYKETKPDVIPRVYILASDNDYIQICNDNIILIDGNGKILCTDKKSKGGFQYLIRKILSGDVSDNIEACHVKSSFIVKELPKSKAARVKAEAELNDYKKCTPSIIEKLIVNEDTYKYFVNYLHNLRTTKESGKYVNCEYIKDNQFAKNSRLIDFQMIPTSLQNSLNSNFKQFI